MIHKTPDIYQAGLADYSVRPLIFSSAYNATKAALHQYSDSLRVELSPLGVQVVIIATGGVKSEIERATRQLPEYSYYTPALTGYKNRVNYGRDVALSAEDFAKDAADQVLATGLGYGF